MNSEQKLDFIVDTIANCVFYLALLILGFSFGYLVGSVRTFNHLNTQNTNHCATPTE